LEKRRWRVSEKDLLKELETIYCQHRQSLFSIAMTVTRCAGLAEDAVHEAFLRMCQKPDRPAGSLVAYVFAAVRNAAVDCQRRQSQQQSLTESLFQQNRPEVNYRPSNSPAALMDTTEQQLLLKEAIDKLDEVSRQVVVMKIFAELTFEEIGEVLQTPASTAATRYRRAIQNLEDQLRRDIHE